MEKNKKKDSRDIIVILLCLSGVIASLYLFQKDLFQTLESKSLEPVGTITFKNNNVQRRLSDRVLWGRLIVESPVYLGDLIRVAEHSGATLHVESNDIDIDENTLIRIHANRDAQGRIIIDLGMGSVSILAGDSGVVLEISGRKVEAAAGSIVTASAGSDRVSIQANRGSAVITGEDGHSRSLDEGTLFALDNDVEQNDSAVVVTNPRRNARYIKHSHDPVSVNFAWNRINITRQLFLEIAEDRSFQRIVYSRENLNNDAVNLGEGVWHWRLSLNNVVLSTGQFTITDARVTPVSPVMDSQFTYSSNPPSVRFEWTQAEGASSYIIEAGNSRSFENPIISRQTAASSFVASNLEAGDWYWRVLPVYSSLFEGKTSFSDVALFKVEHGAGLAEIIVPEPVFVTEHIDESASETETVQAVPQSAQVRQTTTPVATTPRSTPAPQSAPVQPAPVRQTVPQVVTTPTQPAPTPQPAQLLAEPANRRPASGHRIELEALRRTRRIDFSWSEVPEANEYIFTLYHVNGGERQQVHQTQPLNNNSWALTNLNLLEQGTFIWQVEAINRSNNGTIETRGNVGENTFIVDIPSTGNVQINDFGILFGN